MERSNTGTNLRKILASSLLDERADQVETLFAKELAALREALRSERTILGRDGEPVHLGPDHGARLAAGKVLVELCLRNRRPSSKPPQERRSTVTLEELNELIRASGRTTPDGRFKSDLRKTKRRTS